MASTAGLREKSSYKQRCRRDGSHRTSCSILGGKSSNTASLVRRKMKGFTYAVNGRLNASLFLHVLSATHATQELQTRMTRKPTDSLFLAAGPCYRSNALASMWTGLRPGPSNGELPSKGSCDCAVLISKLKMCGPAFLCCNLTCFNNSMRLMSSVSPQNHAAIQSC